MDESSQSPTAHSSTLEKKFVDHLISSLHDTQSPHQPRLLRMLGFSEHEVEKQINDKYQSIHELAPLWGKTVGFTSESIEIPRSVCDEMLNKTRNNNIDHILSEPRSKSFRLHRDRALLMYEFIHQYTDDSAWEDFARKKLEVDQRDLTQIKKDFPNSWEEQQFRILLEWVKRYKLSSSKAIYEKLKTIADVTFPQPTSEESFSDLHSDNDAVSHLQESNAGSSEERKLQELDTELRKQLKKATSSQFFPTRNLVPVQIIKYEKEEREKFGAGFEEKLRMQRETQSASMTSYEEKQLFDEAGKVGENFVGVVGEPGIGKTSLVKVMMEHVSSETCDDCYLFYVPFKGMDFENKMTVFEFLGKYLLPNWSYGWQQKDLLKKLEESTNVYVFADALDEANDKLFSSDPKPIGLHDCATADVIIKNIFSGRLLRNAKKFLTSRPDAFLNLSKKCKPKFNVNMLGLSSESQEKLCSQICGNDEQKFLKVQGILKSASDLSALCRVPFYCQMIVKHLLQQSGPTSAQRVTSTIIFTEVFYQYVKSDHQRGDESPLLELIQLALDGMNRNKFIFDVNDIADVKQESLKNFVLSETHSDLEEKILEGDKKFFFVHLLWQEYFAALHLMFFADLDQFQDFLHGVGTDRWNAVVKFVFGCLDVAVKSRITSTFCRSIKKDLLEQKRNAVKEYGTAVVKRVSSGV